MARVHDLIDDLGLDSLEDLSVENVRAALAIDADAAAVDATLGIDGMMEKVLYKLYERLPLLMTQTQLSGAIVVHRETVGFAVQKLSDAELCHRPNGKRKGWTLTAAGKSLAETLSRPRH